MEAERNPAYHVCGSAMAATRDRRGYPMNRLIAHSLVALALAIGAAGAQAPNVQEKQIVPLIKANWIAFRNYSGRQFIYFSNLLAYRCGLTEIRYSVNSDTLDRVFPLPPCDPAQPLALDAVKYPPFVTLAPGTARQVAVRATFKDGTTTDVARFKPCPNVGDGSCTALVE
jgi:hypothetical protein